MGARPQGGKLTEERVQFSIVRLTPSSYRVENGQIIKHMAVVSDIRNIADSDPPRSNFVLNEVTHMVTPNNITREDMKVTTGTPTEEDRVRELKFDVEDEVINIYETKDHIILVANMVEKVFLTNKVDEQNDPMLQCDVRLGMRTIPKPTLEQLTSNPSKNRDPPT